MEGLIKHLTERPYIDKVYFNNKNEWTLCVDNYFPIVKTRDEVLKEYEASKSPQVVEEVEEEKVEDVVVEVPVQEAKKNNKNKKLNVTS